MATDVDDESQESRKTNDQQLKFDCLTGTQVKTSHAEVQTCSPSSVRNPTVDQYTQTFSQEMLHENFLLYKMSSMFEDLKRFIVEKVNEVVSDKLNDRLNNNTNGPCDFYPRSHSSLKAVELSPQPTHTVPIVASSVLVPVSLHEQPCKNDINSDYCTGRYPCSCHNEIGGFTLVNAKPCNSYASDVYQEKWNRRSSSSSMLSVDSSGKKNPLSPCSNYDGVRTTILDNPADGTATVIAHREREKAVQNHREELARKLIEEMFEYEELADSNVTGVKGKKLLDPDKILAIRGAVFYRYPISKLENEEEIWKLVCEKINAKCRGVTRTLKRKIGFDEVDGSCNANLKSDVKHDHSVFLPESAIKSMKRDDNNNTSHLSSCIEDRVSPPPIVVSSKSVREAEGHSSASAQVDVADRHHRSSVLSVPVETYPHESGDSHGSSSNQASSTPMLIDHSSNISSSSFSEQSQLSTSYSVGQLMVEKKCEENDAKIKSSYMHDFLGDAARRSDSTVTVPKVKEEPAAFPRDSEGSENDASNSCSVSGVLEDGTVVVVQEESSSSTTSKTDDNHTATASLQNTTTAARSIQLSREEMCRNLVETMFTRHELANSNVTGARGKYMLDPTKIEQIREKIFNKYPANNEEEGEWLWRVLVTKINTKCRGVKRLMKRNSHYAIPMSEYESIRDGGMDGSPLHELASVARYDEVSSGYSRHHSTDSNILPSMVGNLYPVHNCTGDNPKWKGHIVSDSKRIPAATSLAVSYVKQPTSSYHYSTRSSPKPV